jgi:hypothetical protein
LFLVSSEMYINSLKDDIDLFVYSVQRTEFVSIVTIDLLMLHREIIGIYFWNYTEYVSTLCGSIQNFITSQQMVIAISNWS